MPALRRRATVAVLAAVAALTLAACGDDGSPQTTGATTTTTTPAGATTSTIVATTATGGRPTTTADPTPVIEVRVAGGEVQGGVRRERVDSGETVVLRVIADVADEVHLHGYDRTANVAPGKPAQLRFTADIPGVFEVELEQRRQKLLDLEVR
jgi:ABC-type amino acid transport substrate-binding protein